MFFRNHPHSVIIILIQTFSTLAAQRLISTTSALIENQIPQHNFLPKTMFFYNGHAASNQTPENLVTDDSLENVLPDLEGYPASYLPLIIGNFGKTIRKVHTHLTSFIFLAVLNTPPEMEKFIHDNGNRRRDRFIFVGAEPSLQILFRTEVIRGLKDKIGLVVTPQLLSDDDPTSVQLLIDPIVYNPRGQMESAFLPHGQDLFQILAVRPLMGRNLRGRHLKISGCLLPTWLYRISDESSPQGVQHDGSNYRIFLEASLKFNFSFEIDAPVGQGYGSYLPNGTWTGMAANLYYTERNFDLAILLGHVQGWFHFVDFASPLDFAKLVFVTGRAKMESNSESFIQPFQREVWFATIGIYVIISITVFVLLLVKTWSKSSHKWTVRDAAFMAITTPYSVALEQALSKVPKNVRLVVGLWMIATITTGTGYRSNLASFLSVPTIPSVPTTFSALASDPEYRVVLNNLGVAEAQFFEFSENPTIKVIKKKLGYNPDTVNCAANAFLLKKMACVAWTPIITAVVWSSLSLKTRIEPLVYSTEPALPVSMSVGFLKDSIIVDAITPITAVLYETGIYTKALIISY